MRDLIEKVKQWGLDRNIVFTGAEGQDKQKMMEAQARYTLKETAELLDAYADQDVDKINDAIGDILVALIVGASSDDEIYKRILNEILKDKYSNSIISTSDDLHQSIPILVDDVFELVKQSKCGGLHFYRYIVCLYHLSDVKDYINDTNDKYCSLKYCLELAYSEIKNRTGKVVNGQFIKDK